MYTFNRTSLESKRPCNCRSHRKLLTFNRTSLESKLVPGIRDKVRVGMLLIEPVWNQNFRCHDGYREVEKTFNRTSLESKQHLHRLQACLGEVTFNRTSLESKRLNSTSGIPAPMAFNRTSLESKPVKHTVSRRYFATLLIEPVWNRNLKQRGT